MAKAAFCIVPNEFRAEIIVSESQAAGFSENQISVLLSDKPRGMLSWLTGLERMEIPADGSYIVSGTIITALIKSVTGGIRSILESMGIPKSQSRNYKQKIMSNNILIFIYSENAEHIDRALSIFDHAGAQEISVVSADFMETAKNARIF